MNAMSALRNVHEKNGLLYFPTEVENPHFSLIIEPVQMHQVSI